MLTCPACSTPDLDPMNDMCDHRYSLCLPCCMGGEHRWLPRGEWNDVA